MGPLPFDRRKVQGPARPRVGGEAGGGRDLVSCEDGVLVRSFDFRSARAGGGGGGVSTCLAGAGVRLGVTRGEGWGGRDGRGAAGGAHVCVSVASLRDQRNDWSPGRQRFRLPAPPASSATPDATGIPVPQRTVVGEDPGDQGPGPVGGDGVK